MDFESAVEASTSEPVRVGKKASKRKSAMDTGEVVHKLGVKSAMKVRGQGTRAQNKRRAARRARGAELANRLEAKAGKSAEKSRRKIVSKTLWRDSGK